MKDVFIVHARRSAIGRFAGSLSSVRIDDLLATLLSDLLKNIPFDPCLIDDVIVGCANQAGEDNRNLARMSLLLAGYPFEIPGTTLNRLCGSSLDAILSAACQIECGFAHCLVVGGAESMSRAPYVLGKADISHDRHQKFFDTTIGWRFPNPAMRNLFPLLSMGQTALEVAKKTNISRERQDQFALSSHQKAVKAWQTHAFDDEIVPVEIRKKRESFVFDKDECPRHNTSLKALGKLPPAFDKTGSITAGNSASINDGAAVLLMVSRKFLKQHNLTPLIQITGGAVRGLHPNVMGLGPVKAVDLLCKKFSKKVSNFDIVELGEAFAVQTLACMDQLELDESKINLNGGAISLGHPLGCSGARMMVTLSHLMKKNPRFVQGLATMCIGVGQGIAISVRNCRT